MMATLENSIAERNCQTLGRFREDSYSHTHPDPYCQPRPQEEAPRAAQTARAIGGGNEQCGCDSEQGPVM